MNRISISLFYNCRTTGKRWKRFLAFYLEEFINLPRSFLKKAYIGQQNAHIFFAKLNRTIFKKAANLFFVITMLCGWSNQWFQILRVLFFQAQYPLRNLFLYKAKLVSGIYVYISFVYYGFLFYNYLLIPCFYCIIYCIVWKYLLKSCLLHVVFVFG